MKRSGKCRSWLALAAFALTAPLHAAEPAPQVTGCMGCHQGALGFSDRTANELSARITALREANKPHPPLPLTTDDAAAVQALAQALIDAAGGPAPKLP